MTMSAGLCSGIFSSSFWQEFSDKLVSYEVDLDPLPILQWLKPETVLIFGESFDPVSLSKVASLKRVLIIDGSTESLGVSSRFESRQFQTPLDYSRISSLADELPGCVWDLCLGCRSIADFELVASGARPGALAILDFLPAASGGADWHFRSSTRFSPSRCIGQRAVAAVPGVIGCHPRVGELVVSGDTDRSFPLSPTMVVQFAQHLQEFVVQNWQEFSIEQRLRRVSLGRCEFTVAITSHLATWQSAEAGYWEPQTFSVFDQFIDSNTVFLDIGGWIGLTSLYGVQLAKRALAFEPDPVAHSEFQDNLRLNREREWHGRLQLFQKAISDKPGVVQLGSQGEGGDSMSSLLVANPSSTWSVEATTLATVVQVEELEAERVFIKVDIEGAEYSVLPSMTRTLAHIQHDLLISLHPQILWNSLGARWNRFGKLGKLLRRCEFTWRHYQLLRSLPNPYLYCVDGARLKFVGHMLKAFVFASFPTELLSTRHAWQPNRR